ncbi:MAG TPA: hypothetical protein VMG12_12820 [Polyangiaceae bacterium]|nr:hypothetical protein [Polyangiaceae bacterium]
MMSPRPPRAARYAPRLFGAAAALALFASAGEADAGWPPDAESDGVYGRFRGDTDVSLKLGGMLRDSGVAGSVGASVHYYSLLGVTGDYSESLVADSLHARSASVGMELRPLFLPRWVLGLERGPAWLDLALDSAAFGFGAYFTDAEADARGSRGAWLSLGFGAPLLGDASGPWVELRALRRFPDHEALGVDAHNALFVYLSWHHVLQLGPTR